MSINWPLFLTVFSFIFIAELPDKTAFATLLMATRSKPAAIFLGVALAFVVQSAIAIAFGSLLSLLPTKWVHIAAGLMFLGFAWHTWFHREEEESEEVQASETTDENAINPKNISQQKIFWATFTKSFMVIFIAEWGDITQLATATLAAKYHHDLLTVFIAAILALWSVTALAVLLGTKLKHLIHMDVLKKVSTVVFIAIGGYFIYSAF